MLIAKRQCRNMENETITFHYSSVVCTQTHTHLSTHVVLL